MQSDWILDVLADLRAFALSNDLPVLAEQLDDTALVALTEIAAAEERKIGKTYGGTTAVGEYSGGAGAGRHA